MPVLYLRLHKLRRDDARVGGIHVDSFIIHQVIMWYLFLLIKENNKFQPRFVRGDVLSRVCFALFGPLPEEAQDGNAVVLGEVFLVGELESALAADVGDLDGVAEVF